MNIHFKIPQNSIYLFLLSISYFFNGGISMFFHHIFRRNFKLEHLYYAYILSFLWKSLTYFIYRFQEIRNRTSKKLNQPTYKKTLFSANKKLIIFTALIDFTIKFCLIQLLNKRPNYDSPMLRFDIKFFFIYVIYKLTPKFNQYTFYQSHKIALFLIMSLSIIQLISIYPFSRETISSYVFIKIPLLAFCEFLMAIKEMCENIMLKKNKVNPFLILSMQGIIEIFLSIFTLFILYITGETQNKTNKRFNRLLSDIVRFVLTFTIMTSYDVFKIIVNGKFTCYHWVLSEKFVGLILGIIFSIYRFNSIQLLMTFRNLAIFLSFMMFCDFIILDFNEDNRRFNFGDTHKANTLMEENEGTEMEV